MVLEGVVGLVFLAFATEEHRGGFYGGKCRALVPWRWGDGGE